MKSLFTTKNIKIFALITIIIFGFSFFKSKPASPNLLAVDPKTGYTKLSTIKPISLIFDKNVDLKDFSISSTPSSEWDIRQLDSKSILITPKLQLLPETKYNLAVNWSTTTITNLLYTTEATQKDYELIKNVNKEIENNYPLAKYIPTNESNFSLVYSDILTLNITIINPNLSSSEIIDEVKSWVTKNGGDVTAHKFVIATP